MELQTEISFWRNPACFGTRSWPTGHTAGNTRGLSCFLGCERAIWPMTSALIIRALYAQMCQVSGKNKPMTPHTTPPHTSQAFINIWHAGSQPRSQLGTRSRSKRGAATTSLQVTPPGWHSWTNSWCLWIHPDPISYGQWGIRRGKGLHRFVPCPRIYHLTSYGCLPLQVSWPTSVLCNTMEPSSAVRTPKSCTQSVFSYSQILVT